MIIKFPNEKTLYVAVTRKCGTTSAFSIMSYPRNEAHLGRKGKSLLKQRNEWWKSLSASPYSINTVDYKFAIVRDPIKRIVSCFKDRIVLKNRENAREEIKTWEYFIKNFEDIRKRYPDIKLHTELQVSKVGRDPAIYDNVYSTSDIGTTFLKDVSEIAEVEIPKIRTKRSDHLDVEVNITRAQRDFIKDFYSDDYTYWGDFFQ